MIGGKSVSLDFALIVSVPPEAGLYEACQPVEGDSSSVTFFR